MFDGRTLLIVAAGLYLLLPLLVWLSLRELKREAVLWWCGGSLLAGMGIVLIGLRPWVPDWISHHVANTALLSSFLGWTQSLRIQLGRPLSLRALGLAVLANAVFYAFLFAGINESLRGLLVRFVLGALAAWTASLAWSMAWQRTQPRDVDGPCRSTLAIAVAYAVLAAAFWIQLVAAGWQTHDPDPFSQTWDAGLLALVAMLTSVIGHFSYVGMMLDAATQEHVSALQQRAQEDAARRLDLRLVQQERERHLSMVAATLAHEINQPLTVAAAQMELIGRLRLEDDAHRAQLSLMFEKVQLSVDRAAAIIERSRSDRSKPVMEAIELQQQIRQARELVDPLAQSVQARIELVQPGQPVWCLGDPLAISQVLVNLMRNGLQALQSVPGPRCLRVSLQSEGDRALLRVIDNGPGLSAQMLERWGAFFQTARQPGQGLGLGLAISRDIVEQHHGTISLANGPDGGAVASLWLPLEIRHGT